MPVLLVNKALVTHKFILIEILIYFIAAYLWGIYKVTQIQKWIM